MSSLFGILIRSLMLLIVTALIATETDDTGFEQTGDGWDVKREHELAKRNLIRDKSKLWPRTIPYSINANVRYAFRRKAIEKALREFEKYTCLKFVKVPSTRSDQDRLEFRYGQGCHTKVGRETIMHVLVITLQSGCYDTGSILHEVMHALGFHHEQKRSDRDNFLRIIWNNIIPAQFDQFKKLPPEAMDLMGTSYDYDSLMQYRNDAFSQNRKNTMEAWGNPNRVLGGLKTFSTIDKQLINAMYGCEHKTGMPYSKWSSWTPCDANCEKLRQRYCFMVDEANCNGGERLHVEKQKCSNCVVVSRPNCKDESIFCEVILASGNSFCLGGVRVFSASPFKFLARCCQACKKCFHDKQQGCAEKRRNGECTNQRVRNEDCCHTCSDKDFDMNPGTKTELECKDQFKYCQQAAANGDCARKYTNVLKTCCASCKEMKRYASIPDVE